MRAKLLFAIGASSVLCSVLTAAALAQEVKSKGGVTTVTEPKTGPAGSGIDFENARPMALPNPGLAAPSDVGRFNPPANLGARGVSPGGIGSGVTNPIQLFQPEALPKSDDSGEGSGVTPEEYGTSGQVYTTSLADAYNDYTVKYWPFRPAGRLFFLIGSSSFVCSASLIKPGVVVTAAHCVANYGQSQFYSGWTFVPAYQNGTAPYGTWTASNATVLTAYYNGTDNCAVFGVVCPDDVAVLVLNPQSGKYPGTTTGWFGYGWGGYNFNSSLQAEITQLGYPVALNGGFYMQRTDSQGYTSASNSNNTIIGSLMTGGSSGGPWVTNFGLTPKLASPTTFGSGASHNIVVGVTSWGYTNTSPGPKQMGAAPFTSGNIVTLVNAVCTTGPC
jgi:V8-like Glu-specific endopeptidase